MGEAAAGEVKNGARGEGAFLAVKLGYHGSHFLGCAKPTHGNLGEHEGAMFGAHLFKNGGLDGCRRHAMLRGLLGRGRWPILGHRQRQAPVHWPDRSLGLLPSPGRIFLLIACVSLIIKAIRDPGLISSPLACHRPEGDCQARTNASAISCTWSADRPGAYKAEPKPNPVAPAAR